MFRRPAPPAIVAASVLLALVGLTGCTTAATTASSTHAPGNISATPHKSAVAAPGGGSIDQTVAPVAPGATTTASIGSAAVLPSQVTITVVSATRQKVTAKTPGEITGPAIVVKLRVTNNTAASIDFGSTVVMLTYGSGTLGQPTTAGGFDPFTTAAAPGKSLDATYVFGVTGTDTNPVQISVSYAGGAPVALFAGNVS